MSALSDELKDAGARPVGQLDELEETGLVVCLTHRLTEGSDQARFLADLASAGRNVLAISVGVPYDVWQIPESITQLAVYTSAVTVPHAVVHAITDGEAPGGVSPVDLTVEYTRCGIINVR
ncbi:MAG: hypothetical protein LKI24_01270 [Acidipropionibacterium sp.]|nr:hypothetical protein [Acidipropionibacterium sp.]